MPKSLQKPEADLATTHCVLGLLAPTAPFAHLNALARSLAVPFCTYRTQTPSAAIAHHATVAADLCVSSASDDRVAQPLMFKDGTTSPSPRMAHATHCTVAVYCCMVQADPPRRRAACKCLSSESSATWCAAELLPTVGIGAICRVRWSAVGGAVTHEHAVESPSANFWLHGAGVARTTRLQLRGWGVGGLLRSRRQSEREANLWAERPSAHEQVSASRPSTRCVVDETLENQT